MTETPENIEQKPIRQVGDYLSADEHGYVVNDLSEDNIQEKWQPVIEDTVEEYKTHFGDSLIAVYVRGSVAKGKAIDGLSDLDNIAIVDLPDKDIDLSWRTDFLKEMKEKYPFVDSVEVVVDSLDFFQSSRGHQMLLKTQGLCVYGKDIAEDVSNFKLGREMVAHSFNLESSINKIKEIIGRKDISEEAIKSKCRVIMKRVVRSGFEIVMERAGRYTRDLYLCWQEFSKYYPEKSEEMREALGLAVYPTADAKEVERVLNGIGQWLVEEIKVTFDKG